MRWAGRGLDGECLALKKPRQPVVPSPGNATGTFNPERAQRLLAIDTHRRHGHKGFDIDQVKSRIVKPAIAVAAIGADIEIGRATP